MAFLFRPHLRHLLVYLSTCHYISLLTNYITGATLQEMQSNPKWIHHHKELCKSKCPNHTPSITIGLSSNKCLIALQHVIQLRHRYTDTETHLSNSSHHYIYTDRGWTSLSLPPSLTTTYLLYNLPDDSGHHK